MTFKEFIALDEMKMKGVVFKPGMKVPSTIKRPGGPEKMGPQAVSPSKPYMPIFRMGGQAKSGIMNKN